MTEGVKAITADNTMEAGSSRGAGGVGAGSPEGGRNVTGMRAS